MPARPCTTRDKIYSFLANGPATCNEISSRTGLEYKCVGMTIGKLRAAGKMHIAEWRPSIGAKNKKPVPAYLVGANPDAAKPAPAPKVRKLSLSQKLSKLRREYGPSPSVFGHMVTMLT